MLSSPHGWSMVLRKAVLPASLKIWATGKAQQIGLCKNTKDFQLTVQLTLGNQTAAHTPIKQASLLRRELLIYPMFWRHKG